MRQQIVLWQSSSQTRTRASVPSWTVGPIDSPEDQIWSKTRESGPCLHHLGNTDTLQPGPCPEPEGSYLSEFKQDPQRVSPAHQQTGHIVGCFRQQKIIMMSPDSPMSATYAQCEPAVWYSPDHPLVSICVLATTLVGTVGTVYTIMEELHYHSNFYALQMLLMLPVLVRALVKCQTSSN